MRIAVAGAAGRMGRTLIEAVLGAPDLELAAALDMPDSPVLGRDAADLAGGGPPCGVRVGSDVEAALAASDCLIDFTRPAGTLAHLGVCARLGRGAVVGTTGFGPAERQRLEEFGRRMPLVYAPNMAVGVNAVFRLAEEAARILGDEFDVEIVEAHHRHKVDAPSGTALRLAEGIASALGRSLEDCAVYGREGITGERDRRAIGIHAVRGGDIVGEHTVIFAGQGERVELVVRSGSRMTYAQGALRACRFLRDRRAGLYDMYDVLGLKRGPA